VIHPDTELRHVNPEIGNGVFATRRIPRGTITWVRDRLDQSFTPEAVQQLPSAYHDIVLKYSFIDAHGRFVLCWDHARFVNHSCDPTCLGAGYDFACRCGSPRCRTLIRPGDLLAFGEEWDRLVAEPFALIPSVPQPLWPFLEERDAVQEALARRAPASITRNFVDVARMLRPHPALARRT